MTPKPTNKEHWGDKYLWCNYCHNWILIKHNQAGGFWHLSNWHDKYGNTHSGGICSPCFNKLH